MSGGNVEFLPALTASERADLMSDALANAIRLGADAVRANDVPMALAYLDAADWLAAEAETQTSLARAERVITRRRAVERVRRFA